MTDANTTTDVATLESVDQSAQAIAAEIGAPSSALALIDSMNKPGVGIYSSIVGDNFADKLKVVEALSNSVAIDPDHLGTVINLQNFIAQAVKIADQESGDTIDAARVILIDEDGTSYHATSVGLASALRTLVQVVGEPATWDAPIPVTVAREKTRRGFNVFTLRYV